MFQKSSSPTLVRNQPTKQTNNTRHCFIPASNDWVLHAILEKSFYLTCLDPSHTLRPFPRRLSAPTPPPSFPHSSLTCRPSDHLPLRGPPSHLTTLGSRTTGPQAYTSCTPMGSSTVRSLPLRKARCRTCSGDRGVRTRATNLSSSPAACLRHLPCTTSRCVGGCAGGCVAGAAGSVWCSGGWSMGGLCDKEG